jgi:hypothetical protein
MSLIVPASPMFRLRSEYVRVQGCACLFYSKLFTRRVQDRIEEMGSYLYACIVHDGFLISIPIGQ